MDIPTLVMLSAQSKSLVTLSKLPHPPPPHAHSRAKVCPIVQPPAAAASELDRERQIEGQLGDIPIGPGLGPSERGDGEKEHAPSRGAPFGAFTHMGGPSLDFSLTPTRLREEGTDVACQGRRLRGWAFCCGGGDVATLTR